MIRCSNVGVVFEAGTVALHDVSLDLAPGEFLAIVGPSGCGKSTLLRAIAGLQPVSAGTLEGVGADLGYVFQDPTLLPWLDACDNVALPLRLSGTAKQECRDRAMEALREVGLVDHESKLPRELSGGMRMRVSVARSLINRPDTLLFDEPFAAVDEIKREALNELLLRLHEERRFSALFVTHSVSEAVFLADRVLVMSGAPGSILTSFDVPFPRPRRREFRFDANFSDLCRVISDSLRSTERNL